MVAVGVVEMRTVAYPEASDWVGVNETPDRASKTRDTPATGEPEPSRTRTVVAYAEPRCRETGDGGTRVAGRAVVVKEESKVLEPTWNETDVGPAGRLEEAVNEKLTTPEMVETAEEDATERPEGREETDTVSPEIGEPEPSFRTKVHEAEADCLNENGSGVSEPGV